MNDQPYEGDGAAPEPRVEARSEVRAVLSPNLQRMHEILGEVGDEWIDMKHRLDQMGAVIAKIAAAAGVSDLAEVRRLVSEVRPHGPIKGAG